MLSNKELAILNYLLNHQSKYITSVEMATSLNMSERTIRKYIGQLQGIVKENGAAIISKQGYGYRLDIKFHIEFENFLKKNHLDTYNQRIPADESKERQYAILNQLLFKKQWILVDDLAEEMFVSRSTMNHDISAIRRDIKKYHLDLMSKPGKGITLDGDERDKRHLIMDYFLGKGFYSTVNKYFGDMAVLKDINLEELSIIVLDETRESGIILSDYILQNLVLHLALAVRRILDGNYVKNIELDFTQIDERNLQISNNILKRVSKIYNINFPEEEAGYIGMHILSKGASKKQSAFNKEVMEQVKEVLTKIENDLGYPMSNDLQLINGITIHMEPLLLRLKNDIQLENPLLEEIENQYNEYLMMTKKYFKEMQDLKSYDVSNSEWAYLTLHILAAIEKYNERKKLRVLLICATGYGSAQMLKVRVEREFRTQLTVANVISYYEIKDYDLTEVDLIISTIDLSTQLFKVPVINVSVLLNEKDVKMINHYIHLKQKQKNRELITASNFQQTVKLIDRYFKPKNFHYIDRQLTKDEVYQLMIKNLGEKEEETFINQMMRQIRFREEFSSIVFSHNVAVPHPVQPVANHSNISVAILNHPVEFPTEKVQISIIFMLSPSILPDEGLKDVVGLLVSLIDSKEMTEKMMEVKSFEEFKVLLLKMC